MNSAKVATNIVNGKEQSILGIATNMKLKTKLILQLNVDTTSTELNDLELAYLNGKFEEIKYGGNEKMASLREEAMAYEPQRTFNIADLDKIPIDIELKDGEGKDSNGEVFTYKYAEIETKQYRVAGSIIGGIKAVLQKMPNTKFVSVVKQGQGMNTRYTVVPYQG